MMSDAAGMKRLVSAEVDEKCGLCGKPWEENSSDECAKFCIWSSCEHCHHWKCVRSVLNGPGAFGSCGFCGTAASKCFDFQELNMMLEEATASFREKGTPRLEFWIATELTLLRPVRLLREIPQSVLRFHGLRCVDFTGHPITVIPPEIGALRSLRRLVLVALHIQKLPKEITKLCNLEQFIASACPIKEVPDDLHLLTKLWDMYFDGDLLQKLPSTFPPAVDCIKVSSNRLESLPNTLASSWRIEEIRAYANRLTSLPESITCLTGLRALVLHSNQLRKLPKEIGSLSSLVWLMLADNHLTDLPDSIVNLERLEWLYLYSNQLTRLPSGLLRGAWRLRRLLIESNPLCASSLKELLSDVPENIHVLGVDTKQMETFQEACGAAASLMPLAPTIFSGWMMPWSVSDGLYAKLLPASQLAQKTASAIHLPQQRSEKPGVLVVAFSASQGEPEWLGVLGKLLDVHDMGKVATESCGGSFQDELRKLQEASQGYPPHNDLHSAAMWHEFCTAPSPDECPMVLLQGTDSKFMRIADFDVLCLCQSKAEWYCGWNGSALDLEDKLRHVISGYKRTLFLGVSMGGFGALLHSHLADTVVVFGPQTDLTRSHLRPGWEPEGYAAATQRLRENVRRACSQGVRFEYHVAVDEHLMHARWLPLPPGAVIVHPLLGRIARLLERTRTLAPVLASLIGELQDSGCTRPWRASTEFAANCPDIGGVAWDWNDNSSESMLVAKWRHTGGLDLLSASPADIGKMAQYPAHVGDWFCPVCFFRNFDKAGQCANCWKGYPPPRTVSFGADICSKRLQPHWCCRCKLGFVRYAANCTLCEGPLEFACSFCGKTSEDGRPDRSGVLWYCNMCWSIFDKHAEAMRTSLPPAWFLDSDVGQTWAWYRYGSDSTAVLEFAKHGTLLSSWGKGAWDFRGDRMHITLPGKSIEATWSLERVPTGFKAHCLQDDGMAVDT
eukprot:CAMPEP_0178370754 /NCGR_PEP_ID=MMETSP0689_2-20121128/470_1 /TAXON_ID=160604 /ORGANISM="Amphidinium massartii, Strain CS-259" /LENGTH=955 /DNA_ID=CAMNT_0019990595 /DNA_START=14 /DNA_END=2878 /DNA_ORIENTATION=+